MSQDNFIPIIIGNCNPFRIITRDIDKWNPSLDEINTLNYDYVKLNRNSTALDVNIKPFSLIVGFDGSLILPCISPYNTKEGAVDLFNRFLGILLIGGIFSEAVIPDNVSYGHMINEGYNYIDGGGVGLIANFHRSIRLKTVSNFDAIQLIDPITITIEELKESYFQGWKIYKKLTHLSPNILLEGVSNYVSSNWAQSLILIWTSIEQLINQIWEEKIIVSDISKSRRTFLNDFRTWTAAAKTETLFLTGYLKAETYELINNARKVRNNFMHKTEIICKESVDFALNALFQLISLITSNFSETNNFDNILNIIQKHQRGILFHHATQEGWDNVKYWRYLPPLPGSKKWGDKPFEVIEDLKLKRIEKL